MNKIFTISNFIIFILLLIIVFVLYFISKKNTVEIQQTSDKLSYKIGFNSVSSSSTSSPMVSDSDYFQTVEIKNKIKQFSNPYIKFELPYDYDVSIFPNGSEYLSNFGYSADCYDNSNSYRGVYSLRFENYLGVNFRIFSKESINGLQLANSHCNQGSGSSYAFTPLLDIKFNLGTITFLEVDNSTSPSSIKKSEYFGNNDCSIDSKKVYAGLLKDFGKNGDVVSFGYLCKDSSNPSGYKTGSILFYTSVFNSDRFTFFDTSLRKEIPSSYWDNINTNTLIGSTPNYNFDMISFLDNEKIVIPLQINKTVFGGSGNRTFVENSINVIKDYSFDIEKSKTTPSTIFIEIQSNYFTKLEEVISTVKLLLDSFERIK